MLYSDSHRWGFAFQANTQMTLVKLHAQPAKTSIKVMERSIYSARYCFVENLYRNNILQNVEYEVLKDWFQLLTSNDACHLDLIKQSITLDYLQQLHERHEEWLSSQTSTLKTPIFIVDANQTKEHVYTDTNTHLMSLVSC